MANYNKPNLLDELKGLLQKDDRFTAGGQLLKNTIVEHALKLDKDLIKLLLSKKRIKEHFFADIDETLVFDKDKFISFVDNKQFLPDSYTAFKINIGLTLDSKDDYLKERKDVVLVWPYKDCVLEGGQTKEEQKRNEIFWNETLAPDEIDQLFEPKVLTNFKRFDKDGEHKVSEIKDTDNLIIKGNNLLALHTLKKRFAGTVKLIYIDPPYNIGHSFNYNDSFNHSSWLTFMKNRLEVARELLGKDGVIFVQINDIEHAYLKSLLDDIFQRENYVITITIKASSAAGHKTINPTPVNVTEYLLVYAKDKSQWKYKPQYVESGYDSMYNLFIKNVNDDCSKWKIKILQEIVAKELGFKNVKEAKSKLKQGFDIALADFAFKNHKNVFRYTAINYSGVGKETQKLYDLSAKNTKKIFHLKRENYTDMYIQNKNRLTFYTTKIKTINGKEVPSQLLTNLWDDIGWHGIAMEGEVILSRGKKPEKLLKRILDIGTEPSDIVLDFFLGTGTTTAVAHKMGCQYIGVEQLDYGKNDSVVRLKNVINGDKSGISKAVGWKGGGDFVYCELMQWNESFIDKIQKAKRKADLAKIWQQMREKAHLSYKVNLKAFDENADEFEQLKLEDQKKFLLEILDKNQLYVNYCEIDDTDYKISNEDKKLNRLFYGG